MVPTRRVLAALLPIILLTGCGGDGDSSKNAERKPRGPQSGQLRAALDKATAVDAAAFPRATGKTLQQIADGLDGTGTKVGLATSVLPTPTPRLGFGVLDEQNNFVYAPTAVYVARSTKARASGPFTAPADLLVTDPPYRSRQAASEKDPFAAVYSTQIQAAKPGRYRLLVVSKVKGSLIGASTSVDVIAPKDDPVAAVGQKAPRVATDTVASARGDIGSIDTRLPPSDMHAESLDDVLGKKPVALLFATPQLCQSRVCGPVVDVALQLKQKYGDRMTFIHQEVYVDNDPQKGLRPPLQSFGLPTEPWLFAIKRDGTIAARLEGSFGFGAFEQAIKAAL